MMARPLTHYLAEFGPKSQARAPSAMEDETGCAPSSEPPERADPSVALQAAREEGMKEGQAAAQAGYEEQLRQEREMFEARLAGERERWIKEESERLGQGIKASFAEIKSYVVDSAGSILAPFITETLRHKMVASLAETIGVLLDGKAQPLIEIHGPEDLLAMLREKLKGVSDVIAYCADESIDVRVVAGQTMIETQLEAWLERLKATPE